MAPYPSKHKQGRRRALSGAIYDCRDRRVTVPANVQEDIPTSLGEPHSSRGVSQGFSDSSPARVSPPHVLLTFSNTVPRLTNSLSRPLVTQSATSQPTKSRTPQNRTPRTRTPLNPRLARRKSGESEMGARSKRMKLFQSHRSVAPSSLSSPLLSRPLAASISPQE